MVIFFFSPEKKNKFSAYCRISKGKWCLKLDMTQMNWLKYIMFIEYDNNFLMT